MCIVPFCFFHLPCLQPLKNDYCGVENEIGAVKRWRLDMRPPNIKLIDKMFQPQRSNGRLFLRCGELVYPVACQQEIQWPLSTLLTA